MAPPTSKEYSGVNGYSNAHAQKSNADALSLSMGSTWEERVHAYRAQTTHGYYDDDEEDSRRHPVPEDEEEIGCAL